MYLKARTKLRRNFNHNLSDFDENIYFPNEGYQIKRSPMRRRYNKEGQNPWTEWYSDLRHGCEDWHTADTMIEGFIHKNIGNKFNDVFHKFMRKVRIYRELHCYRYHTPKSMFLGYFKKSRRTEGTYYVDDEGIIRQIPWKPKRSKDITVYKEPTYRYIYTLREDALQSISVPFITLFGRELYNEILIQKIFREDDLDRLHYRMNKHCSDEKFEVAFNQVRRYREFKHYYYYYGRNRRWVNFLFKSMHNSTVQVIKYGTKEYFQYIRKQKQLKALKIKEKKHPDRSHYDLRLKIRKLASNAMNIIIWSPHFDIKGHRGYLQKTWNKSECPIDWQNVVIGQTINYIFPHSSIIYVCEVVHMKMYHGDLEIQVKVVNIL